jgi:hypothetical protein
VKANPKGLPYSELQLATVTVTTTNAEFSDTQLLRVGMWRGRNDPEALMGVQQNAVAVATNPVRPVAYVSDGGSAVFVYHVYSGKKVNTFRQVAPSVGAMTTNGDGSVLYVTDMTNFRIVALDAVTGTKLGRYPLGYSVDIWFRPVYARPYGQPVLLAPGGPIISVPTGEHLAEDLPFDLLGVPPDGKRIYGLTNDGGLRSIRVSLVDGTMAWEMVDFIVTRGLNCQDIAVSLNGRHVYTACGWPYQFDAYDGDSLWPVQTLPGSTYPNNAEILPDGDFAGGLNGIYEDDDVLVYDQPGWPIGKVPTNSYAMGTVAGTMKISGDGTRVIMAGGTASGPQQTLKIRSMP